MKGNNNIGEELAQERYRDKTYLLAVDVSRLVDA